MENVFDREVSYFASKADKSPRRRKLLEVLLADEQAAAVQQGQAILGQYGEAAYKLYKEKQPCFLISVTCEGGHGAECIRDYTGLFGFDIDGLGSQKNPDWTPAEVKECLSYCKNIAYCGLSFGQNGVWGIVPVDEPERHAQHFEALKEIFIAIGIWWKDKPLVIDKSCGNMNRLRFHSYDPNPTLRHQAESLKPYDLPTPAPQPKAEIKSYDCTLSEQTLLNRCLRLILEAQDGEKHYRLNKAAFMAGGFIAGGVLDEQTAIIALEDAISRKSNVADLRAAFRTIQDGIRAGKQQPIHQESAMSPPTVVDLASTDGDDVVTDTSIVKSATPNVSTIIEHPVAYREPDIQPKQKVLNFFEWQRQHPDFSRLGVASLSPLS